jgi:uncharacterized membrane protein YccC
MKSVRARAQHFSYFLSSRHVSDALLITAGILIPSVLLAHYNLFEKGAILSLGALCVGVTDIRGPVREKYRGMLSCSVIIFLVALVTGYAGVSIYLESLEVVVFCFFFSMFIIYGNRAAAIGTTALMVMITELYKHPPLSEIPVTAALLLAGGLWYSLLSFLFYKIRPYRQIQQVMGEGILEITKSLRIKAKLYDNSIDQTESLNELVFQQIKTNEKQDDIRQILFSSPWVVKAPTLAGRIFAKTFTELMDLYSLIINTTYYDAIRKRFATTSVLPLVATIYEKIADNLQNIGHNVQSNLEPKPWISLDHEFLLLRQAIDDVTKNTNENTFILKKTLVTLRTIEQHVKAMLSYFQPMPPAEVTKEQSLQYALFIDSRPIGARAFLDNLTLDSSIFRYALRVAIVAFVAFAGTNLISGSSHSYWILFTVVFILKPAFSLTKQRNYQRTLGTLAGGLISYFLLVYIHNNSAIFILLMIFMVVAYTFMRINYMVFVIFMTCYILLMFKLLGTGSINLVGERVVDTLIGAAITFIAIYFVFPNWEFRQIRVYMGNMLKANAGYLIVLADYFSGKGTSVNNYKLARKEAYASFANLVASFHRMTGEPKSKQRSVEEIQRFINLNHQLVSLITSNASATFAGKLEMFRQTPGNLKNIHQSLAALNESLTIISLGSQKIAGEHESFVENPIEKEMTMKSQFKLIQEICGNIRKSANIVFYQFVEKT